MCWSPSVAALHASEALCVQPSCKFCRRVSYRAVSIGSRMKQHTDSPCLGAPFPMLETVHVRNLGPQNCFLFPARHGWRRSVLRPVRFLKLSAIWLLHHHDTVRRVQKVRCAWWGSVWVGAGTGFKEHLGPPDHLVGTYDQANLPNWTVRERLRRTETGDTVLGFPHCRHFHNSDIQIKRWIRNVKHAHIAVAMLTVLCLFLTFSSCLSNSHSLPFSTLETFHDSTRMCHLKSGNMFFETCSRIVKGFQGSGMPWLFCACRQQLVWAHA